METINLALALKATDGDVDLLKDVVTAFLDEYPSLLAELEPAVLANDHAVIRRVSHTIKGTLRLFGDVPAKVLAERLEEMGQTGVLECAPETFLSLRSALVTFRSQLVAAVDDLN